MCLHGLDILSIWCCFSPFCVRRLLRFSILTWPRISKFLSRIVWTIHGHVLQEWTRCVFFLKLFVFFVPTMFSGILGSFVENSTVVSFSPFWSARKHTWKYVLLSALLHDQSRLQSSSCFQHQFVWLPFSRTLVCKGGQLFVLSCTWEHEIRVFEPKLRCCVTLA